MNIFAEVQKALDDGYTVINTFMGPLPLTDWVKMTSLTEIFYDNGRLVSAWLPSILHRGQMERAVFELS